MEKNRQDLSQFELIERIKLDLEELLDNRVFALGRGSQIDAIKALERIRFIAEVIEQEAHLNLLKE